MAVKKCCIDNCNSCSTRKEDKGVTYHKFPKDAMLRDTWMSVSLNTDIDTDLPMYVCSRHFCKTDFQIYKDSKYVLRSDAVPSIFPWNKSNTNNEMESVNKTIESTNDDEKPTTSTKDVEIESVAAIRKFIEQQEKEIQDAKSTSNTPTIEKVNDDSMDSKLSQSETISVASSVIDMIITESELELAKKSDIKREKIMSPGDRGNGSMALSVGSKVEAKDYGEDWYPAEIIEVDYDEMEVLVHYETKTKKHDEWISVSSPRLRPVGTATVKPGPSSADSISSDTMPSGTDVTIEEPLESKTEEKVKPTFVVGERCLARWRDNRRFVATIHKVLDNGSYEVIFDDGCHWTCKVSRLYKLKPGKEGVSSGAPNTPATPSPQHEAGPSNVPPQNTYHVYHTHLFDPTRDYLGSKSERREMKRKLNIKEIFNIGQKRSKTHKIDKEKPPKAPVVRKPRIIRRKAVKVKKEVEVKTEDKAENPAVDAVASIIGTVNSNEVVPPTVIGPEKQSISDDQIQQTLENDTELDEDLKLNYEKVEMHKEARTKANVEESDKVELEDLKPYLDPLEVLDEEVKLQQFEKPDETQHEEVIDRIKEAINKLEDGLRVEQSSSPKIQLKIEISKLETVEPETVESETVEPKAEIVASIPEEIAPATSSEVPEKGKKRLSKIKKGKKYRLLQEKLVKKQVEKVKNELEEMRKQVEAMRQEMFNNQQLPKEEKPEEMSKDQLLPGQWCCKWVNGQPVGTVSELVCEELKLDPSGKVPLPRRSVQVEDERLPEGWTKHMVRRSFGHSAGKWDVVLVNPENRRFHTKNEIRVYLEHNTDKNLQSYEHVLTDFGVHMKLARRMGWISHTADGIADGPVVQLPAGTLSSTSPLIKQRKLGLKRTIKVKSKRPKLTMKLKVQHNTTPPEQIGTPINVTTPNADNTLPTDSELNTPKLEDGFVYVGSLKVQIIETLLRCPAEGCYKNFRNTTLLQMHIKHYHRELRKLMGATPKVLDLAYARSMEGETETPRAKTDQKVIKVKIPRPPKVRPEREEPKLEIKDEKVDLPFDIAPIPVPKECEIPMLPIPRSQDSPKLRQALANKPVKRPRVLLPVRRPDPEPVIPDSLSEDIDFDTKELIEPTMEIPTLEPLDFETAISTHTVTKPCIEKKRKVEKKKKTFALPPKGPPPMSEEEDWLMNSDVDTRSSFPRSGTPDSKIDSKTAPVSSESNEENKEVVPPNMYMYNESGERIKIVHMKREEIINCHCGFREEDGLMVQCELCLCWQHALCHNIQRETDVPEKYTCSICLNPRRGRRSRRFLHDQDRMYEGLLPAAKPCESLRRSHELTGNLLRIEDALHALRVKYYVATKKDHPKLYLWAKDWEQAEIQYTQEKLASDYSDLNIMISNIGKENLPVRPDDVKDIPLDIRTSPSEDTDQERFINRDVPLNSQSLLSGLLSSPGGTSLDLPISTSELERLAKSVQEQESCAGSMEVLAAAPEPEAAIENSACRERLLKHLQRCQALVDARLDSIEAQVAELESQDPSFEDDETADYFPRTKQTIQMLMRDLDTMEELGVIT